MSIFVNFVGLYPVSKTLRFELKPELLDGQTIDDFWSVYLNGSEEDDLHKLYMHDDERNKQYPVVKAILDQFHKMFIASALEHFEEGEKGVTWLSLASAYRLDKRSKDFQKLQEEMRKKLRKSFEKHEWWSYMKSYSKLIGELMMRIVANNDKFVEAVQESNPELASNQEIRLDRDGMVKALKTFERFSVYFGNYATNRENMYSEKGQTTSIANRIVNENLPKFLDNIVVYERLKELCPDELKAIEESLSSTLDGLKLDDIFVPGFFNNCLSQVGIEKYNRLLGGNPNEGVLGINSVGNQYLQHHPETKVKLRSLQMTQLFKQILSDRVRLSFLPEQFNSDEELMQSVSDFLEGLESCEVFARIQRTFEILKDESTDLTRIYVQGSNLTKLSTLLYGKWDVLGERLRSTIEKGNSKKARRELDKEIEAWLENKCFSIAQIQAVESELIEQSSHSLSINELFSSLSPWKYDAETHQWSRKSLLNICDDARIVNFNELMRKYKEGYSIRTDAAKEELKFVLDQYIELFHIVELLRLGNKSVYLEKDDFYVPYERLFTSDDEVMLSHIVPLYMKVQSYLTRQLKDEGKILLKFDSPTLADGWDANKEDANNATILLKDGKYYLMIMNPNKKPNLSDGLCDDGEYHKIVYHQIADASKDIQNLMVEKGVTVRKTGRRDSDNVNRRLEAEKERLLPEEINEIRIKRSYLRSSEKFNKKDSQTYLAYYMQRIVEYKRGEIDFHFKKPEEYECYQDFVEDVSRQKYSLSLVPYSGAIIDLWRREKKIFLFLISNKDFSEKSRGIANLHTLYWNEVFSEQNLSDSIFKLNGEAELFFRKKSDADSFIHRKGSILVNKTFSDGKPIEDKLYKRLLKYYNGTHVELSEEDRKILPMVITKEAKYDIVKDKRYHEHKFFLHVPITINFKASPKSAKQFNEWTLQTLRENRKELSIIGIDRGERNLVYVSVINQRGENLIPPRHFNLIGNYDYLAKLKQTERNRNDARKNWNAMARIKDLKSGYLSQVVHEIAKLAVQYRAIVVLEDLNFGFKRGRFNVERQVYQNFEKMLIQKLNYLAFKTEVPSLNCGNIRSGLQLTAPFTSFKEMGKQCGWLFYVPAGYTSKIDPATGFVNLFNMNKPAESLRKFFGAFTEISYKDGLFYFTFDYSNEAFNTVKTDYTNNWTLSSHGARIIGKEKVLKDLTKEFINFFEKKAQIPLDRVSVQAITSLDDTNLQQLWGLFKLLLKMRNSNDQFDFIISPVAGEKPFLTGENNPMQILDADANGAYNIALKGLYWVMNDFPIEDGYLKYIRDTKWFEFVQTKPYLNE